MNLYKLIIFNLLFISISFPLSYDLNNLNVLNQKQLNDKFSLNQSVSFSISNLNGMSKTNNIISNNFNYKINNKLNLNSNIHFISSNLKNTNNTNDIDIKYDFLINYKFSDNLKFQIKMTNLNINNNFYSNFE